MNHTPGPWSLHDYGTHFLVNNEDFGVDVPDKANARLIAAAPDLLEALETLAAEEYRDDDDPVLMAARDKARAAIKKARSSGDSHEQP